MKVCSHQFERDECYGESNELLDENRCRAPSYPIVYGSERVMNADDQLKENPVTSWSDSSTLTSQVSDCHLLFISHFITAYIV